MATPIKGHCYCKGIQFEIMPPTDFCSHCHCESCRRVSGAAFVTWTSVPDERFSIQKGGELINRYESSPGVIWMNCIRCGSCLFQTTQNSPGRTYVAVASLADPLDRAPESHVSFEEHVDWVEFNDELPKYREKASDRLG